MVCRDLSSSSSNGVSRSLSGWSKIQLEAARADWFPVQYNAFTAPFLQMPMSIICLTSSSFGTNFSVLKILFLDALGLSNGLADLGTTLPLTCEEELWLLVWDF